MSEQSGFFADNAGDREYTESFLADWVHSFISNGVYNGELAVTAGANMTIKIPKGRAWINGYYYHNDDDLVLQLAIADGTLKRKDTIVLRWDINTRSITAQVLTGTFASNPVAPAIVRGVEQYDLKLAEIEIPAGATTVSQSDIMDTRLQTDLCGIVTGVIQQVDTSTFAAQLDNLFQLYREQVTDVYASYLSLLSGDEAAAQTAYSNFVTQITSYEAQAKSSFQAWFDGIKGILGTDEAGNLQNEITALAARVATLENTLSNDMLFSAAAWLGKSYAGSAYLSDKIN